VCVCVCVCVKGVTEDGRRVISAVVCMAVCVCVCVCVCGEVKEISSRLARSPSAALLFSLVPSLRIPVGLFTGAN